MAQTPLSLLCSVLAAEDEPCVTFAQYQSAQLMAEKGVNVPFGIAAQTVDEVEQRP